MAHKSALVSRIKGALLAGFEPKLIAYWTSVPVRTIQKWGNGEIRANVPADESVANEMREALLKRFMGRESGS